MIFSRFFSLFLSFISDRPLKGLAYAVDTAITFGLHLETGLFDVVNAAAVSILTTDSDTATPRSATINKYIIQ